jgi:hypothetical protein
LSFTPKSGGADCYIGGQAIDVKARSAGDLLVRPGTAGAVDWYALILVAWPTFTFAGAIRAAEVTARYRTDLGHGPTYLVPQAALGALRLVPTEEQVEAFVKHAVKAEEIRWDIR